MAVLLIVEDDTATNEAICEYMRSAGHITLSALDGEQGLQIAREKSVDLVVLDIMLPKRTGLEVLKELRQISNIPILMLTALDDEPTQAASFDEQADDYITKPFEPEEMTARVEAALRRRGHHEEKSGAKVYFYKELKLYPEGRKVLVLDTPLSLTAYEYEILFLLIRNPEKVYSRELLYEQIWKGGYYGENNTVNVHVSNLRRKIKEAGAGDEYIRTVYGIGFKLE